MRGMFVCRLDRPWLGTPFLMQGFLVQTDEERRTLQHLCQHLYIDTAKSVVSVKAIKPTNQGSRAVSSRPQLKFSPIIERDLAKSGIKKALPIYSETYKAIRTSFKSFTKRHYIEPESLTNQMSQCFESIQNNTTAMTWLSRVKSHNTYTSEHAMHVSMLAMVFAVHCGWKKEEAVTAGIAGLLCDIGKLKVPAQVLNKSEPLNEAEWTMIHDHPKWSRYFLEKSGFSQEVIQAAYCHHERPDGTGYPGRRRSGQTPTLAKLIKIIDAFDALISARPYARQRTVFEATQLLYRGRGKEFDHQLVDQFIEMMGVFPVGTIVELSTGEVGVVIGQNNNARLLPVISVVRDRNKNPIKETVANLRDIADANGKGRVKIRSMLHDGSYGIFMKDFTKQLITS